MFCRHFDLFYQKSGKDIVQIMANEIILYTKKGMGNGDIEDLHDIIWCPPETFSSIETLNIQQELDTINRKMKEEKTNYILIGPGRW